jgi:hypothetical protein
MFVPLEPASESARETVPPETPVLEESPRDAWANALHGNVSTNITMIPGGIRFFIQLLQRNKILELLQTI